jgi:hypothetical protein
MPTSCRTCLQIMMWLVCSLRTRSVGPVKDSVFIYNGLSPDLAHPGANDGLFVDNMRPAITSGLPEPILATTEITSGIVTTANQAITNADYGYQAPGVIDEGHNRAVSMRTRHGASVPSASREAALDCSGSDAAAVRHRTAPNVKHLL